MLIHLVQSGKEKPGHIHMHGYLEGNGEMRNGFEILHICAE